MFLQKNPLISKISKKNSEIPMNSMIKENHTKQVDKIHKKFDFAFFRNIRLGNFTMRN